jgi:nicotinamidase-related amidase
MEIPEVVVFDWRRRRPAILVIDMQVVFVSPEGPFQNTIMDPVIDRLNAFLHAARARRLPVLFSNVVLRADGTDAGYFRNSPFLPILIETSPFIGLDPRIEREESDLMLRRHRFSTFFGTNLDAILAGLGADSVILTGVSINNAISATARDAFARDLPVMVVSDCCAPAPFEPAEKYSTYLEILNTWTADVFSSTRVWDIVKPILQRP